MILCSLVLWYLLPQVGSKFGVLGVLLVAPCVGLLFGALNGFIIVAGRLQPFIVTLAMMVTALGIARLTAGQNNAVLPVYTGSNATADFEMLRSLVFGVIPMPGLFFLGAILIYGAVLRFTPFGRYVYAIGGNEEAARLSGIAAGRVKIATYAVSGGCWPAWRRCSMSRNTGKASRMPAPGWSSMPSPPWSSAAPA